LVRELTCDELFEEKQRDRERHEMTWKFILNSLGNIKSWSYRLVVKSLLGKFQKLVCNMSLWLLSYIHIRTLLPKITIVALINKGTFHQDTKEVENSFEKWNNTMIADCCWAFKREISYVTQKNSWSQIIYWILINVHLHFNILHNYPFICAFLL
jgi:hypothetical protein